MESKRFPSRDEIEESLKLDRFSPAYYPAMTGAMTAYYKIAVDEFEELRRLTLAMLEGGVTERQELRKYLNTVDAIGELQTKTRLQSEATV
jgi:hypothetical protein